MSTARTEVTIRSFGADGSVIVEHYEIDGSFHDGAQFLSWLRDQGIAFLAKMKEPEDERLAR